VKPGPVKSVTNLLKKSRMDGGNPEKNNISSFILRNKISKFKKEESPNRRFSFLLMLTVYTRV
jgi:hypothetical protein